MEKQLDKTHITKQEQIEHKLPNWALEMFCDWLPKQQVWKINQQKLHDKK